MNLANLINVAKTAVSAGTDIAGTMKNVGIDLGGITETAKGIIKDVAGGKVDENTRNDMFKKICGIIPNQVDNKLVVNAFEVMRKQQQVLKKDFSAHLKANEESFKNHLKNITASNGYVEDQNNYKDMAYGESTMAYSGCEIFATFNAMYNITKKNAVSLSTMISEYEKDGMVLSGKFGTAPKAIADFLTKQGFKTQFTTEEADFDDYGKNNDSLILTMYNDKDDISKEVHTVNISKDGGKFTAHNVYCNGKVVGPYNSVSEVISNINSGKAKGISLIGVRKA